MRKGTQEAPQVLEALLVPQERAAPIAAPVPMETTHTAPLPFLKGFSSASSLSSAGSSMSTTGGSSAAAPRWLNGCYQSQLDICGNYQCRLHASCP